MREYRLLVYIEEMAHRHELARARALAAYGQAAQLSTTAHEASARALRKLSRHIRTGAIPGWRDG